ncbi:fascin domain-containing protein [Krasilnikovia sp. MM14-A1004]|uniref:fascin domain-containing protein n=1 Tax=Krasilnikovia sp. MM14-A1004 TaxID=3373541 RepID=UPI00399CEED4
MALSGAAVVLTQAPAQAAPLCSDHALVSYADTHHPLVVTVETTWAGNDYAKLRARKTSVGTNEKFRYCWYTDQGYYTIQAKANNRYVTAENGFSGDWKGVLRATATSVGDRQKFRITAGAGGSSEYSKLQNVESGKFVSAEMTWSGDIKGILRARANSAGAYERFQSPSAH